MLPSLQWLGRAYNSARRRPGRRPGHADAPRRQMVASSIRAIANLIADNPTPCPSSLELERRLRAWLEELRTAALNLPEALRIKSLLLINQWMSETELGQVLTLISGKGFEDIPQNLSGKAGELAGSLFWTSTGCCRPAPEATSNPIATWTKRLSHWPRRTTPGWPPTSRACPGRMCIAASKGRWCTTWRAPSSTAGTASRPTWPRRRRYRIRRWYAAPWKP
ncbi:hypothetical protein P4200_28975 [Pseudomonas aeruginosa]|nr:hypothetical protein [Pseudomonas aeruginosa]